MDVHDRRSRTLRSLRFVDRYGKVVTGGGLVVHLVAVRRCGVDRRESECGSEQVHRAAGGRNSADEDDDDSDVCDSGDPAEHCGGCSGSAEPYAYSSDSDHAHDQSHDGYRRSHGRRPSSREWAERTKPGNEGCEADDCSDRTERERENQASSPTCCADALRHRGLSRTLAACHLRSSTFELSG